MRQSLYHLQPQLDDILNDEAPFPYTLGAFIAFLSEYHCLETVEFLLETERYRRIYRLEAPTDESVRRVHLLGLWRRLIQHYIQPQSPREINIPAEIRERLINESHGDPPPPDILDSAVHHVKDLLRGSVLIPFLRRCSASAHVQPLSMPDLNGLSVPATVPCVADDIRVRNPRGQYPWPCGYSSDDARGKIHGFTAGSSITHAKTVPERTFQASDPAKGWRRRIKDEISRHFRRSSD